METSSEDLRIFHKNSEVFENESFDWNENFEECNRRFKLESHERSRIEEPDKDSTFDMKSDIDFESWMTETEDEDEDIFITPQRVSTGKEERDTIDGIEFLGFETEHDMVEFTKIELDFQGGALQEENVTHSDDGLDMMDDSYTYSESEIQTTSQAIIPTKTKDITKIKGWRTKNFAINNNPSDGQCSSSSVGPYEDDDGFVSCDIKIEEDVSLDMEERDLWSGGEQDLFIHDDQLSLEKYSLDESLKKLDETFVNESQTKCEEKSLENIVKSVVQGNEDVEKITEGNIECDNSVHDNSRTGRYPKRHSQTTKSFCSINTKEDLNKNTIQENQPKVVKKRGRKPKTFAEKQLLLQLANQYKRKRKRGRPKGSKNKKYQLLETPTFGSSYNLRNSSRKESGMSEHVEFNNEVGVHKQHLNKLKVKNGTNEEFPSRELLETASNETTPGNDFTCSELSSTIKIKEEPIDFELSNNETSSYNEINVCNESSSNSMENNASYLLSSYATTTHTTNSEPITAITNISGNTCSSVTRKTSNSSTVTLSSLICSPMPSIPIGKTQVTSSLSITTSMDRSSAHDKSVPHNNRGEGGIKQKSYNDSVVSLVNPPDKAFEYGLVLSTGIGRPVIALALEQLKTLRKNNVNIDEHWARFAASVVTTQKKNRITVANTVVLPVRARSLPFTSCSSSDCGPTQQFIPISNRTSRPPEPKLAPIFGPSVRFRCPRPLSQVGVRTLPKVTHHKNLSLCPPIFNPSLVHQNHLQEPANALVLEKLNVNRSRKRLSSSKYNCDIIDDEIRKVVDDIVKYVERTEANGFEILNDPDDVSRGSESSITYESVVTRKKKAPMIRELTRLDVNVIEMWDAKNKECTEEFCKLGCVCESLECCRPAIDEHCGKEECMFKCECEPKSYKRGDNKQHLLLSPLSLLNIPQQNRRVLAKEEKEFQQTVIRAKHETIVVGSNGSSRRKREIKLPGRYRDSYVALGKEYGLVDFKISSDEIIEPPAKRPARVSLVNKDLVKKDNVNKDCVSIIAPKSNPIPSKVNCERKSMELKEKCEIKECYVKLEPISNFKIKNLDIGGCEEILDTLTHNDIGILPDKAKTVLQNSPKKSRNMAVKSTTPRPFDLHDLSCHSARTAPVHTKFFRKRKDNAAICNTNTLLPSIHSIKEEYIESHPEPCIPKIHNTFTSDLVIDNCSEGFGKIESVTTLSVEQFQKGDLGFGLEHINHDAEYSIINEETKSAVNTSPEKSGKGKISSCNLTVNKIADLLNRRMRELKETGGNDSFLSPSNDESIHLLPWPVLKTLFQIKDIQLWYYKGGSKLIITSKNLRPEPSFVNLNDISPFDYKQLPSIITDLLKNGGQGRKINNPDVYALLHFDGQNVELVGTIYKNQSLSQSGNTIHNNNLKIGAGPQAILPRHKAGMNTKESSITSNLPSSIFPGFDFKNIVNNINLLQANSSTHAKGIINQIQASASGQSKGSFHPDLSISDAKEMCKNSDFAFVAPKTVNMSPLEQSVMKPENNFIPSPPGKTNKPASSPTELKRDPSVPKNCEHYATRVRKFRTVLQSTKVETASGECFPVPLPLCVVDSKWYVLSMEKAFDVLQVNKKCSVRHRHIVESIKMALKHCKTVRLPLQVPRREHENSQQPRFGVYSVPCISTFVFIGPFYVNEGASISTYIIQRGKLVCTKELPVQESNSSLTKVLSEKHSSIVDLLKKVWLSSKKEGKNEPWLYARRRCSLSCNDTPLTKDSFPASKGCNNSAEDEKKQPSKVSEKIHEIKKLRKNNTSEEKVNEQEVSIIKNWQNRDVTIDNDHNIKELENVSGPIKITSALCLRNACDKKITPVKDNEIKNKTASSETNDQSVLILSSSPSSSRSFDHKKNSLLNFIEPTLQPVSAKVTQPESVAGWLVPSYPWIGSMHCHFDVTGGLFFLHPVSGVKMIFSNLESAQLWLDRLFQSAILYIPRQLFITWTLKVNSGEDGIQKFDNSILNGDYIMTSKGIFDIDKLIPTEAEKYGLKPIEILRLQDKKRRRDLELGFFQLRRALQEMGRKITCNKKDLIAKAIETIVETEAKTRQLEKDKKRWRNIKHKSLLHMYNMMKVLPTQMKRHIVHKVKTEYDQTEATNQVSSQEPDLQDGLTFSMSRYCGNTSIFGDNENESNIDDYLSEYNEESDDCYEKAVELSTNSSKDKTLSLRKEQISDKGEDDDESVSISVVSSSQIENEDKPISNSDDITVTYLNDSENLGKPVNRTLLKQVTSLKDTTVRKRKFESSDLQGTFILHSPQKLLYSSIAKESEVAKSTLDIKKKLLRSSTNSVFEGVSKRVKTDSLQVTPLSAANAKETKSSNFDGQLVKQYSAIPVDSPKLSNDLLPSESSILATTENCISALKSNKQPILNPLMNQISTANTLFVNVISSNQSKLVPLHVDNAATTSLSALRLPVAGATLPVSNNSLTLIQNDAQAVFSKVQNDSMSVLVTNPTSPIVQTTGVLTPVKLESQRPLITVKSFAKECSSTGRDSTNFLPTLVPIIDGKLKTRIPSQKSIKTKPKNIAPMPTLIPIVDGIPADAANKKK